MRRPTGIDRKGMEYLEVSGRSIKAVDDQLGTAAGYLAVFNNVDLGQDKILPGAFTKTIRESEAKRAKTHSPFLIPLLWNHDTGLPAVGGISAMKEDSYGLAVEARLDLGNSLAKDIYSGLKFGSISPLSIGYKTVASSYEKDPTTGKSVRLLSQLDLMEGSFCNFAMNPLALMTSVKRYWPGYSARQKGNAMSVSTKDFNGRYAAEQLDDWQWSDWGDLTSALKASIGDCFSGGGDPLATFETDVAPQLLAALRSYIAEGVSLGYTGGSGMDMGMMSMSGAGVESKAGYLTASDHVAIKESSAMIMKHAKIIQSASANVERANARARAGQLAGWPVYGSMSDDRNVFEEKAEEEEASEMIGMLTESLKLQAGLRELKEMRESNAPENPYVASVDAALTAFLDKRG